MFNQEDCSTRKWDLRFLEAARQIGTWSKDPSTRVGAIVVLDRKILATGYNGFPRGIADTPERLANREVKYKYVVHGEMNAIYNALKHGISLKGATLYAVGLPICSECAKGIIQVGISRVVVPQQTVAEQWIKSCDFTKELFAEAGIEYYWIES
jgi:dCMP deaminase